MARVIVHIDLNAFFVRCEEIKNPALENKPVAVGREGRAGIVSTCSYEARKFGVCSGMPTFKAKSLCPQLILMPGDYRFYSVMSKTFFKFIRRYTKFVEVASVDECFADFTEAIKGQKDVVGFFRQMQLDLYKETQLKCSIGVSITKFLAKMASDFKKPMGLTIIRKSEIKKYLFPLKIEAMYGIGKKTAPRLRSLGINTIGDLYDRIVKQEKQTIELLGKSEGVIRDWLEGRGSDEIELERDDPKSIGNSTTLPYDTDDYLVIDKYLVDLAQEVSFRAKKEDKLGYTVQIVVKDQGFKSHNKSHTLENPFNDWNTIYQQAKQLFQTNFNSLTVRLVGITLQNLIDLKEMAVQMSLFDYEKYEEESTTKLLINEINRSLKKPLLKRASEVDKNEHR
ncbi:MAG: DNA polymerase IV [Erysipelotrichaceae bacterium]|jgi:DNA polymerase-4|nr:DNA polymerase IV [Erysipelotrichaceae bacterium]